MNIMNTPHLAPAPIFGSLRWRLTAAISGVVLLCAVACITGAVIFLRQALTDRATADMRNSLTGVSGFLEDQRRDLLGLAELVAADPAVQASVRRHDPRVVTVQLTHYFADLNNADVLDVIDEHGRVLTRMEDTVSYNDVVLDDPGVRAALADRETTEYSIDLREQQVAGGYALRATAPIHLNGRVIGAIVVGRQLRSDLAGRIGHALNVSVNLIAGNQRTGTTATVGNGLPATGGVVSQDLLQRIATGKTSIATVSGDCGCPSLSGVSPLLGAGGRPVGAVELVAALNPIYDVITKLSFLLLALGAVVIALGITLAMGIARRLTAQLLALDATAARVAALAHTEGPLGDLHQAVTVRGEDEVASLARSFRAMMIALDERLAANRALYESAQARVRELTGLAEIARLLTVTGTLQETLKRLGEQV
jgi:sensor histidine kinase regulating citrate/malate metabolism